MKQTLSLAALCLGATAMMANAEAGQRLPVDVPQIPGAKVEMPQRGAIALPYAPGSAASQSLRPFQAPAPGNEYAPEGTTNFYTFQFVGYGTYVRAMLKGNTANPRYCDVMKIYEHENLAEETIMAGTMVGDQYYAYVTNSYYYGAMQMPNGLYKLNMETGALGQCLIDEAWSESGYGYNTNFYITDMSYDPTTGYIYGIRRIPYTGTIQVEDYSTFGCLYSTGVLQVVRIDPKNPKMEVIGEIVTSGLDNPEDDTFVCMAVDRGVMYLVYQVWTVDSDGEPTPEATRLCKIDVANFSPSKKLTDADRVDLGKINKGKLQVQYSQDMDFNHSTHELWWASIDTSAALSFKKLNLSTLTTETVSEVGNNFCYLGLAIPYQVVDNGAPAVLKDFVFTPAADGVESITFTWTNPSVNYNEEALGDYSGVKVYRDGALLETLPSTGIGKADTYTDSNVASGVHSYKFVPYNTAGDGIVTEFEVFIGKDTPSNVQNIQGVVSGENITLTWEAPYTGEHYGWIDASTLTYKVVRMPDNVVVADGISETTLKDSAKIYKGYSYVITPSTAAGAGKSSTSKVFAFGSIVEPPYRNEMNTMDEALTIQVIDGNLDGNSWEVGYSNYDTSRVAFRLLGTGADEDYLVLPEFNLQPGKKYQIRAQVFIQNMYPGCTNTFEMVQGKEKTAASLAQKVIGSGTYKELGSHGLPDQYELVGIVEDGADGNYLALRCSGCESYFVEARDFEVYEYGDRDLCVKEISGNKNTCVGDRTHTVVTVRNYGAKAAENFKIDILDPQDNVLGTATVDKLEAGETKDIDVTWIPKVNVIMNIRARVETEGDVHPEDNYSAYYEMHVGSADDLRWSDLGKKENTTWAMIYHALGSSSNYTIFPASMLCEDDIDIFKVEYYYDNQYSLPEMEMALLMAETGEEFAGRGFDSEWSPVPTILDEFPEVAVKEFQPVKGTDCVLSFELDEPVRIRKGLNLAIQLDYLGAKTGMSAGCIDWHVFAMPGYSEENETWPTIYNSDGIWRVNGFTPYTRIGYKSLNGVGTIDFTGNADLFVVNGVITASAPADMTVYDMAGRMVASVKGQTQVSGLANGVYVVVAHINGKKTTTKVYIN